ncbi:MAG: DUF4760 domain-containing protein [Pseudomonadota bacterium]
MSDLGSIWVANSSYISDAAIVLSAGAAVVLVIATRQNARRAKTLDFILKCQTDGDILAARKTFVDVANSEQRSSYYVQHDDVQHPTKVKDLSRLTEEQKIIETQRNAIRTILNLNELTAVSILEGAMDERVYRRWGNGTYIKDYDQMTAYIAEVRNRFGNPAIYKEFEWLARKWKDDTKFVAPPGWLERKRRALGAVWSA